MNGPCRETRRWRVRIRGPFACFTDPGQRAERGTYDVPPHSAIYGVLRFIFWKPEFDWNVYSVSVQAPIRKGFMYRNELKSFSLTRPTVVSSHRTQKGTTYLKDVDYIAEVSITVKEAAVAANSVAKYEDQFERYAHRGAEFDTPYLGLREFRANWSLLEDGEVVPDPIPDSREIGLMYFDTKYSTNGTRQPYMFWASLKKGVLAYPSWEEVLAYGKTLSGPVPYAPKRKTA